jgi:thioredoxin-related protein
MITQNIVDVYTTVYWQQKAESMIGEISIEQIYRELTGWKIANKLVIEEHRRHYVSEKFPKLFPKSDFDMLLQGNSCSYCNITTEKIEILADKGQIKKKSLRGWVLEIDRLDSNFEYSKANCVMACYWCNNAKTDEFTQKEFEEIGKSIEIIWKNRLASL